MSFLRRRRADRIYRDGGWGPRLTWPVPRADGPALVYQMRLPTTVQLVDIATLAARSPGAPEFVAQGADALKTAGAAGVIVTGALIGEADGGEREVLATLTVAFSELSGPPTVSEGIEVDGDTRTHTEVTKLSDKGTQVRRLISTQVPGQPEPVPMVVMEYLMESRFGALAVAFSTTHRGMMGEFGSGWFRKIVETGFIGDQPQPY
jgi:hypothetical protein